MNLSNLVNANMTGVIGSKYGIVFTGILSIAALVFTAILTENQYMIRGKGLEIRPIRDNSANSVIDNDETKLLMQ